LRTAALRLGELLEQRGQITRDQLLRALRNQKVVGGRLGTCLLEIEAVSEEELCSALAQQQGAPCATPEELRGIPDDVLALLPSKVARRCHAIAFQASSTQVKVALIDARDLAAQDEISFVVGKRIRWYVALELRLMEALEKHHGEECPARMAKLLDKMNRSRFLWARDTSAVASEEAAGRSGDQLQWDSRIAGDAAAEVPPGPAAAPAIGKSAAKPAGRSDGAGPISPELPQFQHQSLDLPLLAPMAPAPSAVPPPPPPAALPPAPAPSPTAAPPAPPPAPPRPATAKPARAPKNAAAAAAPPPPAIAASPPPAASPAAVAPAAPVAPPRPAAHRRFTVEETEKRLLQTRERDDVARAILDFAAGVTPRAVLFVVRRQEIAGWLGSGEGIDAGKLAALRLDLAQPSLFAGLREAGAYFRGPLSPLPAHALLAACFAAPALSKDVLVLPVKVKERLVAALLVEPRSTTGVELSAGDLSDLQRVVAKAEIAFELCIMQSKLRKA
jgi:hypothetical protein